MRPHPAWSTTHTILALAVAPGILLGLVPAVEETPSTARAGLTAPEPGVDPPVIPSASPVNQATDTPTDLPTEPPTSPTGPSTEPPPDPGLSSPTSVVSTPAPTPVPAPTPTGEVPSGVPAPMSPAPDASAVPVPPESGTSPASTDSATAAPDADVSSKLVPPAPAPPVRGDVMKSGGPGAVPPAGAGDGAVRGEFTNSTSLLPSTVSPTESTEGQLPSLGTGTVPTEQPLSGAGTPWRSIDTRDVAIAGLSIFAIIVAIAIAFVSWGRRGRLGPTRL